MVHPFRSSQNSTKKQICITTCQNCSGGFIISQTGTPTFYLAIFFPKTVWKWRNFGPRASLASIWIRHSEVRKYFGWAVNGVFTMDFFFLMKTEFSEFNENLRFKFKLRVFFRGQSFISKLIYSKLQQWKTYKSNKQYVITMHNKSETH